MEVERFNYFRKDSDCKKICNTNIYVSSQFNLCAKRYRDRGQQITLSLFGKGKTKSNAYLLYVTWIKVD